MYTHIIWDFNGTLLNDVDAAMKSVNTLLKRRNLKTIDSISDYHKVFCFPIIEYYKKIGFDFVAEDFKDIAVEWVDVYLKNSEKSKLYDGVTDILEYFKEKNIPQIILSATEVEMLKEQLKQLGIKNYFDEILGLDNIHANSKADIALEFIKNRKPKKAVIIGDTMHDFEVSKLMGIDSILISNGHQSKEDLTKCGTTVLNNIKELSEFLKI